MNDPSTPPDSGLPEASELIDFLDTKIRQDKLYKDATVDKLAQILRQRATLREVQMIKAAAELILGYIQPDEAA